MEKKKLKSCSEFQEIKEEHQLNLKDFIIEEINTLKISLSSEDYIKELEYLRDYYTFSSGNGMYETDSTEREELSKTLYDFLSDFIKETKVLNQV